MTTSVTINHVAAGSWRLRIGPTADIPEMTTWPVGSDDDTWIHVVALGLIKAIERESRHVTVTRTGPASFTVDAPVRVEQEPAPGCITVTVVPVSEVNPVFWIAKADGHDGVIHGGIIDAADPCAWACVLTPRGWQRVPGTNDPPMSMDDAWEALVMLAGKCHDAGLHYASVDTPPFPDAPGSWRMEVTYRTLWPEE